MVLPRRGWAIVALITGIMASGCATTPPPDDTGVPLPAASSSASKASSMPSRSTVEPTPARATSATPTKIATTQPLIHRNTNGSLTVTVSGDLLWHPSTWGTAREDGHGKNDFAPIFGTVAPILRNADVSICHEEVPIAPKVLSTPAIQSSQCPLRSPRGSLLSDSTPAVPPRTIPSTVACQV